MNSRERQDLDRWITGNWGEDSVGGGPGWYSITLKDELGSTWTESFFGVTEDEAIEKAELAAKARDGSRQWEVVIVEEGDTP
jgi:hypothetical protein